MPKARKYSTELLELIAEGMIDRDTVINAFCSYVSESDIQDMMESEGFIEEEEEEADED